MTFFSANAQRELAFDQVWQQIAPVSSKGRSLHRSARPFLPGEEKKLEEEWKLLELISSQLKADPSVAADLNYLLATVRDISPILSRVSQGAVLDDVEFYEVKKLLFITEKVQLELENLGWERLLPFSLALCQACLQELSKGQGRQPSFYLASEYSPELKTLRRRRETLENALQRKRGNVEATISELTGRSLSAGGELVVSKTEQEVIRQLEQLSKLSIVQRTEDFVKFSLLEDGAALDLHAELSLIRTKEEECKQQIRRGLSKIVSRYVESLEQNLHFLASLDFLLAKAKFCAAIDGIRPRISSANKLLIQGGRHLPTEREVEKGGFTYTPLTVELKQGVTLLTGPNMGGKTVSLKTIGLLTALAQHGLLVPAQAFAFKLQHFILTQLDTSASAGLSRFAQEIVFLRQALEKSSLEGLILIDEIAQGTNPQEGAALAQAVIEQLNQSPSVTIITTHYPALARLQEISQLRVKGLDLVRLQASLEANSDKNTEIFRRCMDYRLVAGEPARDLHSDAAAIAEVLGLDGTVIRRAQTLLAMDAAGRECE